MTSKQNSDFTSEFYNAFIKHLQYNVKFSWILFPNFNWLYLLVIPLECLYTIILVQSIGIPWPKEDSYSLRSSWDQVGSILGHSISWKQREKKHTPEYVVFFTNTTKQ